MRMACLRPSATARGWSPASRSQRSFVLLEVIVSMVILGITLASVLRGYTNALKALTNDRRMTTAVLLAQALLEDFEIETPEDEGVEGDFGHDFPGFSFVADFEDVEIKYRDMDVGLVRQDFRPLRKVVLRIYHQPDERREARLVLRIETFLTGIDKYAREAKLYNALY